MQQVGRRNPIEVARTPGGHTLVTDPGVGDKAAAPAAAAAAAPDDWLGTVRKSFAQLGNIMEERLPTPPAAVAVDGGASSSAGGGGEAVMRVLVRAGTKYDVARDSGASSAAASRVMMVRTVP